MKKITTILILLNLFFISTSVARSEDNNKTDATKRFELLKEEYAKLNFDYQEFLRDLNLLKKPYLDPTNVLYSYLDKTGQYIKSLVVFGNQFKEIGENYDNEMGIEALNYAKTAYERAIELSSQKLVVRKGERDTKDIFPYIDWELLEEYTDAYKNDSASLVGLHFIGIGFLFEAGIIGGVVIKYGWNVPAFIINTGRNLIFGWSVVSTGEKEDLTSELRFEEADLNIAKARLSEVNAILDMRSYDYNELLGK